VSDVRLWVSARIPFTPIRVGTSTGGGRGSNTGLGGLVLFGILLLVPISDALASMPWYGWIVFPAVILSSVAAVWAPWRRAESEEHSDRR
jgi:hypothetical protein